MKQTVLTILVVSAIIMQMMGGYIDMTKRQDIMGITKQHAWNDAVFLLLLATFLVFIKF